MAINLLSIEPSKISRDLAGYIIYLYGAPKSGKTSLATQIKGSLLLAFEHGYNALGGVYAQDIMSWSDVRTVVRELKKPEVKDKFSCLVFDTIDIAAALCEKYICAQNGVEKINEIAYGGGYALMRKEFEDVVRTMTQLGYSVFFISHDKDKVFKRKDGTEYNQTVPSCPNAFNEIAKNLADIYAYAEKYEDNGISKVRLVIRSTDNSVDCGCRFKYIDPVIDMSYQALEDAVNKAIDKEAAISSGKFVTSERAQVAVAKELDYDTLINEFNQLASELMRRDSESYGPKITYVVNKYLGTNKKVSDSTPAQVELIDLINQEIKSTLI